MTARRWRGREFPKQQVANACDFFVNLTPASPAPAQAVNAAWAPLMSGQDVPLFNERTYGDDCEQGCRCESGCSR